MNNHIHLTCLPAGRYGKYKPGIKKENVQRDFLKYASQTIMRDLELNHPQVLEVFKVDSKYRKYQVWQRNPLSIEFVDEGGIYTKDGIHHYNPVMAGL